MALLTSAATAAKEHHMKNPVQEAINALGGRLEDLAVVCRVSAAGVWRWLQSRKIHNAQHAVMAADACAKAGHPEITVARLAGLDEQPKSGASSTASSHPRGRKEVVGMEPAEGV